MGETWFRTRKHAREREARHVLVEGTWEFIYNTWEDGIRHHVSDSIRSSTRSLKSDLQLIRLGIELTTP